jgi:glycosyltransferase involved in cell wall biosynthesis
VADIPEMLPDGKIAPCMPLCDAYVSAHHAEAWGLPLSEAMVFSNPVIGTGYSGNMEFMNDANSFPVPYTVVPVSDRICRALPLLFHSGMTWADIDTGELVRTLRRVRALSPGSDFRKMVSDSIKRFSPEGIQEMMRALLSALYVPE